jgi:hypothetical protein
MPHSLEFYSVVSVLREQSIPLNPMAAEKVRCGRFWLAGMLLLVVLCGCLRVQAANRSAFIPYDDPWIGPGDFKWVVFDQLHQQIFTAWPGQDRVDVLSAADYHLIGSIPVPSPSSLDISPDGTTLAVATSSAHVLFYETETFVKTNDVAIPDSALGITAFVYTANGNAVIRAIEGLSTGGGITAYWDHVKNTLVNVSNAMGAIGPYLPSGPVARSGDYSTILLGDATTGGVVQIVNGNTGQVEQRLSYFGSYIDGVAANNNASRYALCVEPAGYAPLLLILDSSLNELYQDQAGCLGMTFSADGSTLYRDVGVNGSLYTQSLNMTTFAATNTSTYYTDKPGSYQTTWQAADATGMVYGLNVDNPYVGIGSLYTKVFVAVDSTATSVPAVPPLNDPVQIVRVIDNVGSPQGGDLIRILCTGVDNVSAASVSVTIGGQAATNLAVVQLASLSLAPTTLPNLRLVEVNTPPGTPGLADVTLNANGTSDTAAKAFQYAQSSKVFPFSTNPNFLLYDNFRQKLYAAHKDQVEVIDPIAQQVLTPLIPASAKLQNSQFAGLSLSPDGNRLYIADAGANLIHLLDLSSPGTGTSINPGTAMGSPSPISPGRVFETASGRLVGSDVNGNVFMINGVGGSGASIFDALGNKVSGLAWSSTNRGAYVFIAPGLWDDSASQYTSARNEAQQWTVEEAANEDGTVIVAGGSTPGVINAYPEIVDFDLNTAGLIEDHFDTPMPSGTPSFFLHPSGAVLYKAGEVLLTEGITPFGGLVEIDDLHRFQPTATIVFPEAFITSYSPYTDHMLATDDSGRYLFGVTKSGITMMVLNTIPLSIGNLQPAFGQPAGGQTVTIRGSGFQSGAVASFGGVEAATAFVDANTLTATVPELSAGRQDVMVTNPNGTSYTSAGMFQVLAGQPVPVITGFSPAALIAESGIPGFDRPLSVTILGSGFAAYDTVEINGQPTDSALLDASDLQATIPAALTGQTGSMPITVVSPYTGASNSLSLPMVNPVPVIQSTLPEVFVTGSSSTGLGVYGTAFVAGSVVQWNGQNLPTYLVGGETGSGEETVNTTAPASLLASTGTATITVFNPPPGGGISNAFSVNIAPPQPVVSYPANIDFGQVLLNTTVTQTLQLMNGGSANYTVSSVTITSSPFSVQGGACTSLPPGSYCNFQIQFSPTTAGTAGATLTITDNAAGSPHNIPVTGTGIQTPVPAVTLTSIDSLGQTITATVYGTATVGTAVPATAWIEYGTDPALATYMKSPSWSFTGDGAISGSVNGLSPASTYAARLAVQTAGGTGKSGIRLFATMPAWPSVALALAPGASNVATISAGQTATYQLVASDGGNGYTGSASFSCSGAPLGATCAVTPSTVNIGVNATPFTVTVTTTAASSALLKPPPGGLVWAFVFLLSTTAISFTRRRHRLSLLICLAALAMLVSACGGSGSSSTVPPPPPATPSGTYYLTISASAGGAQGSYLLTLNVK